MFGLDRFRLPLALRQVSTLSRAPFGHIWRVVTGYLYWPFLALAASFHRRLRLRATPVIVVIGSFGKTTTRAAVVAAVDGRPREQWGNSWSRLPLAVLRHRPGSPLVLEVGISRRGQMRRYARLLRPTIVVLTSIGSEHRRSLGSLEATQREKGEMIARLQAGGVLVANGDDPRVRAMALERPAGTRCVFYGWGPDNAVRGSEPMLDWPRGSTCSVAGDGFAVAVRTGLIGPDNLRAVLAALAVTSELRIDPAAAAERLAAVRAPTARMEPVVLPSGVVLLRDDFKSAVETIESALDTFASVPARRRFIVLGSASEFEERQTQLYLRLGERAARVASRVLAVASSEALARGARRALPRAAVTEHHGVHEIARTLAAELESGDVVLIKGRTDQKLGRVAHLLAGREVRCGLLRCPARGLLCEHCPRL